MLDLDVREEAVQGSLSLSPGTGPSKALLDAMRPGPIKLGPVPADTFGVVVLHDDLASRKDSARTISDAIARVLGKRLSETDGKQIGSAMDAWAAARGDWLGLGIARSGAVIHAPAGDKAGDATKDLAAL